MTAIVRPPSLPGIGTADLAWWNALVSHSGRELPLGSNATASFEMASAPDPTTEAMQIRCENGPALLLVIEDFPFQDLLGVELELADLSVLPADLADALRQGLVSYLGALLAAVGVGPVHPMRDGTVAALVSEEGAARLAWFAVRVAGLSASPIRVRVGADRGELVRWCGSVALAPAAVRRSLRTAIPVEGAYTLGRLVIGARDTARLQPGALAVLGSSGVAALRCAERLYELEGSGAGCVCTAVGPLADDGIPGEWNREDARMAGGDQDGTAAAMTRAATLNLDFDLGSVTVSLADLESWAPGSLVPLQPPRLDDGVAVTIRHRGQAIGSGELVRIDNRVAVRITRIDVG